MVFNLTNVLLFTNYISYNLWYKLVMTWWVETHYSDSLWTTFGSSIIIHIIKLFQKYNTFNLGYQFWFLGPKNHYFYKLNVILYYLLKKFITYIEGSMNIFRRYINIIGPLFHFDYTNFKALLVIKTINFNEIKKAPLAICLSSSMWMWLLVNISIY
jgi:hypothetical protein